MEQTKLLGGYNRDEGEGSSEEDLGEMKSCIFLIGMLITELPINNAPDIY